MLDIASLQQFDFFSHFTLYAGKEGIYNTISNVVILDHEGLEGDFSDFYNGDFVITNLLYAKDKPELILSSFKNLIPSGISAIAIKSIYFHELPAEVIALADEHKIPIFFFDSIYIEDVLLNIMDYIRSSSNYIYIENLLDSLVCEDSKEEAVGRLLDYCKKDSHFYLSGIYLTYNDALDDVSILRNLNHILHGKSTLSYGEDIVCTKYKKGILIFYFSKTDMPDSLNTHKQISQKLHLILQDLHLNTKECTLGINDTFLSVSKIDIAIKRALYANKTALTTQMPEAAYSKMHLNNLLFSILDSPYSKEYLTDLWDLLETDSRQGSCLVKTLTAYVHTNCHIEKTAELLFQHPNTIRYRLQKIKTLLDIHDDFHFNIITVLMVGIQTSAHLNV